MTIEAKIQDEARKVLINTVAGSFTDFLRSTQPEEGMTLRELSDQLADMYCDVNAVLLEVVKGTASQLTNSTATDEDVMSFTVSTVSKCLDITNAVVAPSVLGHEIMAAAAKTMIAAKREEMKRRAKELEPEFREKFTAKAGTSFSAMVDELSKKH